MMILQLICHLSISIRSMRDIRTMSESGMNKLTLVIMLLSLSFLQCFNKSRIIEKVFCLIP